MGRRLLAAILLFTLTPVALAAEAVEIRIGYLRVPESKAAISLLDVPPDNDGVAGAQLAILGQQVLVVPSGVPAGIPALDHAEAEAVWVYFMSQETPPRFRYFVRRAFLRAFCGISAGSSVT